MPSSTKKNRYKILKIINDCSYSNFDSLQRLLDVHPLSLRGYLKKLLTYNDIKAVEEVPKRYELTEKGATKLKFYEKKLGAKKWWTPPWADDKIIVEI